MNLFSPAALSVIALCSGVKLPVALIHGARPGPM